MITNNRYSNPKVRLLSDLHMEGYTFQYKYIGEDILILAGDINTKGRHTELLGSIPSNVQILMVAGNHEFYRSDFNTENMYLKSLEDRYANFKYLDNSTFVYNDIYFYGGTMFTDFLLYGEANRIGEELAAKTGINDFSIIKNWTINKHKTQHQLFVKGLKHLLRLPKETKRVVISHFCPSFSSIDDVYRNSGLNSYFVADMEKYMGDIQYWIHGHVHGSYDYYKGNTRVICNPKGYGLENINFDPNLIIDMEF